MITALTNITWEMVRHAPRFAEICDRLVPMLDGKVFVAHNAEFDWRFVTTEIARATGQRLEGERLCTVRLARKLLPELRSRRLDVIADYFGITIEGRHRAGGDARATAQLLVKLLRELADRDCLTFEAMRELLARRARRKRGRRGRRALPRGMDRDASA
jgi:DNA polymerase-3 subunit epsilon